MKTVKVVVIVGFMPMNHFISKYELFASSFIVERLNNTKANSYPYSNC